MKDYRLLENSTPLRLLSILKEIILSPDNAVDIHGSLNKGHFTVGDVKYTYEVFDIVDEKGYPIANIFFQEYDFEGPEGTESLPTGNAGPGYYKILATVYKIILKYAQEVGPDRIGIGCLDKSGYWNIYNNLVKHNKVDGYTREKADLTFTHNGFSGKIIVLKRTK